MDLKARKIEFVGEFLKLENEEAISKLEKILRKKKNTLITVRLNRCLLKK